jgi:hypothetical protein
MSCAMAGVARNSADAERKNRDIQRLYRATEKEKGRVQNTRPFLRS